MLFDVSSNFFKFRNYADFTYTKKKYIIVYTLLDCKLYMIFLLNYFYQNNTLKKHFAFDFIKTFFIQIKYDRGPIFYINQYVAQ